MTRIPHSKPTTLARSSNLRQRLLKASRVVNNAIVTGLHQRGFTLLRSTHTALLSNLDMTGSNLTTVAQRAGMSKQAMGRVADELIKQGYIVSKPDTSDGRAVKLVFTSEGLELMEQSFQVLSEIEKRSVSRVGQEQYQIMLSCLNQIVDELVDGVD